MKNEKMLLYKKIMVTVVSGGMLLLPNWGYALPQGGQVVGVNSFTLDGNKDEVADAKDVLSKKGVTYKNIWFKSDSEAGKFTSNLYSFPTTYVIDQNGNIVGEPIMGGINSAEQREALNKLIDQALAKSEQ